MIDILDLETLQENGRPLFGDCAEVTPERRAQLERDDVPFLAIRGGEATTIAVCLTYETPQMVIFIKAGQHVDGSFAKARRRLWAGQCFLLDVSDAAKLRRVLADPQWHRVDLYRLDEAFQRVDQRGFSIAQYLGSPDAWQALRAYWHLHKCRVEGDATAPQALPAEGSPRMERRASRVERTGQDHTVIPRFLAVRSRNVATGAHEIPLVRISPEGSEPSVRRSDSGEEHVTTRSSMDAVPDPEPFAVCSEHEARVLLMHFASFVRLQETPEGVAQIGTARAGAQNLMDNLAQRGALAIIKERKLMIHGTPIVVGAP